MADLSKEWEQSKPAPTDIADEWNRSSPINTSGVVHNTPTASVKKNNLSWSDVPMEALKNMPSSAVSFGESLVQPIIHPIDTAASLGDIAVGGLGKVIPGISDRGQEGNFDAVVAFFKDRYGTEEGFKKALATDPVGIMADVSSLFTGGGAALRGAGVAGKASKLATKIGETANPLSVASGLTARPIAWATKKTMPGMLGATTGAGANSIRTAFAGGKPFRDALRGNTTGEEIYGQAKGALYAVKEDRALEYQKRLADISRQDNVMIDMKPIRNKMQQLKQMFNIRDGVDANGKPTLDFSRSTLDRNAINDVKDVIEKVNDWGTDPADLTPIGMDILKRQLDDFYSPSKNSRAFVTSLKKEVKNSISSKVPEYERMLSRYNESSGFIDEIEKTLSLGDRKSIDTGLRKLTTTLKDNYDFRNALIKKLDTHAGGNLEQLIAGTNLSGWMPTGLRGWTVESSAVLGTLFGQNPAFLALMPSASPRVVGEFVNILGRSLRNYQKVKNAIPGGASNLLFQTGRIANTGPQMIP